LQDRPAAWAAALCRLLLSAEWTPGVVGDLSVMSHGPGGVMEAHGASRTGGEQGKQGRVAGGVCYTPTIPRHKPMAHQLSSAQLPVASSPPTHPNPRGSLRSQRKLAEARRMPATHPPPPPPAQSPSLRFRRVRSLEARRLPTTAPHPIPFCGAVHLPACASRPTRPTEAWSMSTVSCLPSAVHFAVSAGTRSVPRRSVCYSAHGSTSCNSPPTQGLVPVWGMGGKQ
jgi:hypothetical protein